MSSNNSWSWAPDRGEVAATILQSAHRYAIRGSRAATIVVADVGSIQPNVNTCNEHRVELCRSARPVKCVIFVPRWLHSLQLHSNLTRYYFLFTMTYYCSLFVVLLYYVPTYQVPIRVIRIFTVKMTEMRFVVQKQIIFIVDQKSYAIQTLT